jgi:hypothetical protein
MKLSSWITQSILIMKFNFVFVSFVFLKGDNFYPNGVDSTSDSKFDTVWKENFLVHKSLRVAWNMVLGNHDYEGNYEAQVKFTTSKYNPDGIWNMPARNYSFRYQADMPFSTPINPELSNRRYDLVKFCGLDTNGAQSSVRRRHPQTETELSDNIKWLSGELCNTQDLPPRWNIVFAHHPMFTKSNGHGTIGKCLRGAQYVARGMIYPGYNLSEVFADHQVHAYFTGRSILIRKSERVHYILLTRLLYRT